jgi:hypothetical protein
MARPSVVSLVPPVVNLVLYAGDGANLRLTATDLDGEPFDLRGTVRAQIRASRRDQAALAEWAVEMAEAEQGVLVLRLASEDTRALMKDADRFKGAWDCVWTMADSEPVTLIQGDVQCDLDVTR